MPNNTINWGQGAANNSIGWGQGATNNTRDWGWIHSRSYGHDETNLVGAEPSFFGQFGTPAAAYSLRDLSGTNSAVIEVRRSSDNAVQDFTASEITDGSLATWVGVGNDGFVRTFYNQAGANDATQTTAVNQPLIVDAGVLVEENGLPAISFDGTDDFITSSLSGAAVSDSYFVMNYDNDAKAMSYTDLYTNDSGRYSAFVDSGGSNADLSYGTPSYYVNGVLKTITTRSEAFNELSNGKGQILRVDQGADTSTWQDLQFGLWFTGFAYNGTLQEFVIYQEDKSSDRTDIETNINDHYSIY